MRVIGGRHQRRTLCTPRGLRTRPILDRVKQALFDALGSRFGLPGALPPFHVLDLFCGGGTLGIEALSRGAASCVFVESDREALACLRRNLDATSLKDASTVVAGGAETARLPPAKSGFSLIFLDAPFPMSEAFTPAGPIARILDRLGRDIAIAPNAVCIWRHDERFHAPDRPAANWRLETRRVYGRSALSWLAYDPVESSQQ